MSEHVLTMRGAEAAGLSDVARSAGVRAGSARPQKPHAHPLARWKRNETLEYRALFAVTFAVFLVAALAEALIPRRWRRPAHRDRANETIIHRASTGARNCVAYAFMG